MNKQDILKTAAHFVETANGNYVARHTAISENIVGMKIFEEPLFAFGSPDDEYFTLLKETSAIGSHFLLPREWLPGSRTVISFFLPFSKAVREGNKKTRSWPSEEWLHGRIEGQTFVNKLCLHLKSELINAGYPSLIPSLDARFWSQAEGNNNSPHPDASFTSNWSERHVAFVCGLGTFGLSKGLITPKGMAGRFGSILTELYIPPDTRTYEHIYEYCSQCGACIENCPVNAISREKGKNHKICSAFLNKTLEKYKPRYGCGKCQTGVPCEGNIPRQPKPYGA